MNAASRPLRAPAVSWEQWHNETAVHPLGIQRGSCIPRARAPASFRAPRRRTVQRSWEKRPSSPLLPTESKPRIVLFPLLRRARELNSTPPGQRGNAHALAAAPLLRAKGPPRCQRRVLPSAHRASARRPRQLARCFAGVCPAPCSHAQLRANARSPALPPEPPARRARRNWRGPSRMRGAPSAQCAPRTKKVGSGAFWTVVFSFGSARAGQLSLGRRQRQYAWHGTVLKSAWVAAPLAALCGY